MSIPATYTKARAIGDIDVIWEEDVENVLVHADGRVTRAMLGIIPDDQFPLLKQGYGCAQCFTRLDVPFPERCPTCNFPMRERQTAYIAKSFVGNVKTGPSTTLEDEKLIMQEMREREARRLGIWTPPGRVI
jgi:hypothetical protein